MELFLSLWRDLVRILGEVGRKMHKVGAKMAPSWAPDGPYWRLDGHLGMNLGGLGSILGLSWWILEGSWEVLGRILEAFWHMGGIAKAYSFHYVFIVFGSSGGLGGGCRDVLAPMLDNVGRKMGPRGVRIRIFRPTWRLDGHLGAKMAR